MANTFTQMHVQCVFAVKFREALILPTFKERLHQYITQIVQGHGHKMLRINTMPDHLHMFFGYNTEQKIPDLMRIVKGDSSKWINDHRFTRNLFRWQSGYGSFSYSKSQVPAVAAYIADQEIHHKKMDFSTEYKLLLDEFGISYDEKYLFHAPV
jgi:putative transposase